MKIFDTIAAISTPYGKGGVAMIRISGADAFSVADSVFKPARGVPLSEIAVAQTVYGAIYEPSADAKSTHIDDGMAVRFASPHSFTGEDTVEISCHGGILVTAKVLGACLSAGARQAEAGEFTRRAFINGKMALSEAESLGKLLEAKTASQLYLASNGLRGALTKKTAVFYNELRAMLASIYARIDFPDEDLADMSEGEMESALCGLLDGIKRLAATYGTGRAINEGVKTVICGRANAGKSSVYNRLVGFESAIVTDVEGTTRDVLRDVVSIGKTTLCIADTAGLRETEDKVENIGIERARAEIENAELVLAVFDSSRETSEDDLALIEKISGLGVPSVALFNKSDKETLFDVEGVKQRFEHSVSVSTVSGEGFSELADIVDSLFIDGEIDIKTDAVVADARQHASLVRAAESLRGALDGIAAGLSLDVCCVDVEEAMMALGELDGREIGEEIVAEIFSKFCVGK